MPTKNKDQDFWDVKDAAAGVEEQLIFDDDFTPDLYQQYKSRSGSGSNKIFLEPYKTGFSGTGSLPMFRSSTSKQHSIRLPAELLERRKTDTQVLSLMGILPEINRVWVSIDNCLYLWNYTSSNSAFELAICMDRDDDASSSGSSVGDKNKSRGHTDISGTGLKSSKMGEDSTPGSSASRSKVGNDGMGNSSIAIVSVALSAPKPGIFHSDVKYVLVVATTMHVALVALKCGDKSRRSVATATSSKGNGNNSSYYPADLSQNINNFQSLTYLQTEFVVGTDNILCRKVIGTQMGRIFMCGSDCNLYEMTYDSSYNSWSALSGANAPQSRCHKVKLSGWNFSWRVAHFFPPMMRANFGFDEYLSDMVVDDIRNVLYTSDSYGNLSVFYLGERGDDGVYASHSFNLFDNCQQFLSRGGQGEGAPSSTVFNEDSRMKGLKVISLHVIPMTESRKCHAMAVLSNGVRVYLRLLNSDGTAYLDEPPTVKRTKSSLVPTLAALPQQRGSMVPVPPFTNVFTTLGPSDLAIAFVRAPPDRETVRKLQSEQSVIDDGFHPAVRVNDCLNVHSALYHRGVLVMATAAANYASSSGGIGSGSSRQQAQTPASGGSGLGFQSNGNNFTGAGGFNAGRVVDGDKNNQVLALCDDNWARDLGVSAPGGGATTGAAIAQNSQYRSSLRESLSCVDMEFGNTVHDMKENCSAMNYSIASQLLSLNTVSYTPMRQSLDDYTGVGTRAFDCDVSAAEVPALTCTAIAASGRKASLGIPRNALDQIPISSELAMQHLPAPTYALQRQFLILESDQLRVMQKLRPVDYLYDTIQTNLQNPTGLRNILRNISNGYGPEQYCAMCVGIACGLPCDAGGNPGMSSAVPSLHYGSGGVSDPIKDAALSCLRLPGLSTSSPSIRPGHVMDPVTFDPSQLSDANVQVSSVFRGLQLFLSRLLRPIWLRPLTEIRAGRDVPSSFLSPELLISIATPLHALQEVMLRRSMFRSTILSNNRFSTGTAGGSASGTSSGSSAASLSIGTVPSGGSGVSQGGGATAGMGRINPTNFAAMNMNQNLTADEIRHRLAQQYEDECICKMYRLLKRAIQSLHLIETLLIADADWKLPVKWADFRNQTFRKLNISLTTHEKVKMSLRKLILSSTEQNKFTKDSGSVNIQGNLIANLTRRLKADCYMYYSVGDEKWHEAEEGLASLEKMLAVSLSTVSPEIQQQARQTIQCLVDAACHWHDLELVDPTLVDNVGEATELEAKCMQLMRLGKIGRHGVPELCMAAARNFIANNNDNVDYNYASSSNASQAQDTTGIGGGGMGSTGSSSSGAYDHRRESDMYGGGPNGSAVDDREIDDRGMYHGGSLLTKVEMERGTNAIYRTLLDCILSVRIQRSNNARQAANSSSAPGARGGSAVRGVSNSDALQVTELVALPTDAREVEQIMLDMINDSIRYLDTCPSQSEEFLSILSTRLFTDNGRELLLQLSHPYVRAFLESNDTELLYRWYNIHGYHDQATALMYSIATSKEGGGGVAATAAKAASGSGSRGLDIATRIEYLQKAWRSASVANNTGKYDYQVALQIAEAWQAALQGYQHLLQDMESMQAYNNSQPQSDSTVDYTPFINNMRDENVLDRIQYSFISEELHSATSGNSLDSTQSALRSAATSREAKWLLAMLKKWCLWEQYLRLHKSMQSSPATLASQDIAVLWRSIIYRNIPAVSSALRGSVPHKFFLRIYELMVEGRHLNVSTINIWWDKLNCGNFDSSDRGSVAPATFDNWDGWLSALSSIVVNLGLQLSGSEGSGGHSSTQLSYLPCALILSELEKIISMLNLVGALGGKAAPRGFASKCLFDMNVSFGSVVEAYTEILSDVQQVENAATEEDVVAATSLPFVQLGPTESVANGIVATSADVSAANEAFHVQLLESSFSVVVEWFKHTMASSLHHLSGGSASGRSAEAPELYYFLQKVGYGSAGMSESKSTDVILSGRQSSVNSKSQLDRYLEVADYLLAKLQRSAGANASRAVSLQEQSKKIRVLEKQFLANR